MIERTFYTAPEICGALWLDIFKILKCDHDTGEEYQRSMCTIYNEAYMAYRLKYGTK